MANTSIQRARWGPACRPRRAYRPAYQGLDAWLARFAYPLDKDSGAFNCRAITGGTGFSLHAYGPDDVFAFWDGHRFEMSLAVDIQPSQNSYGPRLVTNMPRAMVEGICAVRANNGELVWDWGGYFTPNHDAMHFQIACTIAALRSGIDARTLPHAGPAAPARPPVSFIDQEDDDMLHSPTPVVDPFDGAEFQFVLGTDFRVYASVNGGTLSVRIGAAENVVLSWPRVVATGDGIAVTAMGVDGQAYQIRRSKGQWGTWRLLGGAWDVHEFQAALAAYKAYKAEGGQ